MMNIGYVVSRFPKTTETFIAREALGVSELGHQVSVIALNREKDQIVQAEAAGFVAGLTAAGDASSADLVRSQLRWLRRSPRRLTRMWTRAIAGNIKSGRFLSRALVTSLGAPWAAEKVQGLGIEHLHAHWGTHSALLAYQLSILTDVPYSVTLHAHDLYVDQYMLNEKLREASTVVTISDHNRQMIEQLYPDVAHKIEVVHCGVDVQAIAPRPAPPGNEPPTVAVVAGLRDYKGHAYLIDAHKILDSRGFEMHLDLVGDGPMRDELEAMVSGSSIADRVTFHGARPVDEAIKVVHQADVFVMPSVVLSNGRKDGIPVALMEAMALQVPVISTRVSGIPELVEDDVTGLLVDERDPVGLADALQRLLTDRDLQQRLAAAGRNRVVEQFDLTQTVNAMDQIVRGDGARPEPRVTVAMVIQNYLPTVGGAERQLNSLNPRFVDNGITPVVYTRSRPGQPSREILNGASVVRVRCVGPKPVQSIMYVLGTLWHLTRTKPDVVHAYDTLTPSLIAGLHRLISGTPYLTKLLRSGELGDLNRLANKPLGTARLQLLKRSVDKFVAISHDLEAELGQRGVSDDRRVFIPNGVDTERFRPPTSHELNEDPGGGEPQERAGRPPGDQTRRWNQRKRVFPDWPSAPVAVVVGRISPEKRVIELARRWEQLGQDRPDGGTQPEAWLYVVGEGPLSSELDGLGTVRFLGKREDMADILRWSDMYVSASSAEGLSNALLEAMASGCPCVVTDVGGVGDVMTDRVDGRIVDPEGSHRSIDDVVDDIITEVENLIDDPDQRLKLGKSARQAVLRRYSLESTATALADEYLALGHRQD